MAFAFAVEAYAACMTDIGLAEAPGKPTRLNPDIKVTSATERRECRRVMQDHDYASVIAQLRFQYESLLEQGYEILFKNLSVARQAGGNDDANSEQAFS